MKVKQITISADTQLVRVESDYGELIGIIRIANLNWIPAFHGITRYVVQKCHINDEEPYRTTRTSSSEINHVNTLIDAFLSLGVSYKELNDYNLNSISK